MEQSMDSSRLKDPSDDVNYFDFNKKYQDIVDQEHVLERYEDRTEETSFSRETARALYHGKLRTFWRGLSCIKDPCTIVILQQLLWDVKPRTIIEFGANTGGSAFFVADTMKTYGFDTHVYSMDINLDLLGPLAKEKRQDVTFLQGDCNKVEETFTPEMLTTLPHPWFLMDDAHVNTFGVFDYFDKFTMPGDYIVVEDTDPWNRDGTWGHYKLDHLSAFMKKHSERYRVDTRYTDFFGYNGSNNRNGFITRI